jgi:hypothetical protein
MRIVFIGSKITKDSDLEEGFPIRIKSLGDIGFLIIGVIT